MGRKSKGQAASDGAGRSHKGDRKRLERVVASLEKARAKRDRAQSRVEALEALADELASRVAAGATTASQERAEANDAAPAEALVAQPKRKRRTAAPPADDAPATPEPEPEPSGA